MNVNKLAGVLFAAALLAGCATPKSHYNWADYQTTIYQYYQQSSSPEEQIAALNKTIEQSRAQDKAIPPGLYAHLGLLYAKMGHTGQAFTAFATEKNVFPESAPYMDFLMSKDKGSFK